MVIIFEYSNIFLQIFHIQEYRLYTVTSAASYQELPTIREFTNVDGSTLLLDGTVFLNYTHVDDVLTGANSKEDAFECQAHIIKLCSFAHFELRKWARNNTQIL